VDPSNTPVSRSKERNSRSVFIGLGSNLGDKEKNLQGAIAHLQKNRSITIVSISPFYNTEPQGYEDQPDFLNCVVKVLTALEPEELLATIKGIEKKMGRKETQRWRPRVIDLDILFYDTLIVRNNGLRIPHPEAHKRWFVLKPMSDIEPDFEHPVLKKSIRQLLEELYG
jgi:2-amino-4-hydroxy-6-hydroxymethyldihydropteridine diphosphokinase